MTEQELKDKVTDLMECYRFHKDEKFVDKVILLVSNYQYQVIRDKYYIEYKESDDE